MMMIADALLVAGALGAALYCFVLARRLRRFNDLEKGVGGAVAVVSAQVDDLTKPLENAQKTARTSVSQLNEVSGRAEAAHRHLELLIASMHDVPQAAPAQPSESPFFVRRQGKSEVTQ